MAHHHRLYQLAKICSFNLLFRHDNREITVQSDVNNVLLDE